MVPVATQTTVRCLEANNDLVPGYVRGIFMSSIKVMNTYRADSVKQAKKQEEVFSVIQSCRREYREGSIFWTELKKQRRSLWRLYLE